MENLYKSFYIQYLNNDPVKIKTHVKPDGDLRVEPLLDVSDLISAVKQTLTSKFGNVDLDQLTLHYSLSALIN